jgi:hypothetical protein
MAVSWLRRRRDGAACAAGSLFLRVNRRVRIATTARLAESPAQVNAARASPVAG